MNESDSRRSAGNRFRPSITGFRRRQRHPDVRSGRVDPRWILHVRSHEGATIICSGDGLADLLSDGIERSCDPQLHARCPSMREVTHARGVLSAIFSSAQAIRSRFLLISPRWRPRRRRPATRCAGRPYRQGKRRRWLPNREAVLHSSLHTP